ncbi:MAG: Flp family type IVb pilin [Ferrovum sp.]|jgi:pilus assembly protein Flp/PilA|nr:Flp family type IVb pilin [Ferrovum sp.]NDU87079.1 Flp family type IVb pilin [Ferrovum sp.]
MNKIIGAVKQFARSEEAVTAIEYALLAALIAVAIIGGATLLGSDISGKFSSIGGVL